MTPMFSKQIGPATIALDPDWGFLSLRHREKQRSFLSKKFKDSSLEDLSKICVRSDNDFFSISHCGEWGGFATANVPVGFDIEKTERVSLSALRKAATEQEIEAAPSLAALWCAKEAIFKTLVHRSQPKDLTSLEIADWRPLAEDGFQFQLQNSNLFLDSNLEEIHSRVYSLKGHAYALSLLLSKSESDKVFLNF